MGGDILSITFLHYTPSLGKIHPVFSILLGIAVCALVIFLWLSMMGIKIGSFVIYVLSIAVAGYIGYKITNHFSNGDVIWNYSGAAVCAFIMFCSAYMYRDG